MMAAYDVWRGVMYCVGVFVTCNVGGAALRWGHDRVSGLMKSRTMMVITESAHVEAEPVPPPRDGQSFADMQRQISADTENTEAG